MHCRPALAPWLLAVPAFVAWTSATGGEPSPAAEPVVLTQVVSREHPDFNVADARIALGRDGRVYLASARREGYALRLNLDGSAKTGGRVTYALNAVAANKAGLLATAHFNHAVNLWSPDFQAVGSQNDFLKNDQVQWHNPFDVDAGETDFYGMDGSRNRVVRVAPDSKLVTTYSLAATGEDYKSRSVPLRVREKGKRLYVIGTKAELFALGF